MSELMAENQEKRKLVGDSVEVDDNAELGTASLPDGPMRVFRFGSFRTDASESLLFCKAQVREESISGRRQSIRQGAVCG